MLSGSQKTIPLDNGVRIEIVLDENPMNPREWDNLGKILYKSDREVLGDENTTDDHITKAYNDKENLAFKVYAMIHSGIGLRLYPYECQWDSGCSGIIYATKEKIRSEYGVKNITRKIREKVRENFAAELETFQAYLNGFVYGYVILDADDNHLDSCYGYYSIEDAETAAKDNYSPVPVEAAGI